MRQRPRCAGCGAGARRACPPPRCSARCSSSFSTSSSTPSPRAASVLTIGTRQPRCGASDSTPRISRTIVSVSGWSALLTTMMSGISMIPAFSAWIESPEPGMSTSTTVSAWSMTSTSAWPTPTVSRKHVVLARGVHEQRGLQRRLAEPAERAAVGHRADEDAGVEEVVGQADAVAQQRAVGERRRRVDRQHRDLRGPAVAAELRQRADERRLAGAGRAGEADDRGAARVRVDLADELPARRVVVLDERDGPRQRALVAVEQALGEGLGAVPAWAAADYPPRPWSPSCPRPRRPRPPALDVRARLRRRARRPAGAAALPARARHAQPPLRAPGAAPGVAEAALARAAADRRPGLRRPGRDVRDRPGRARPPRALVVDRPRHARSAATRARSRIGAKTRPRARSARSRPSSTSRSAASASSPTA